IHGLVVRTDLDVVPPSKRDREALADPGAQLLGLRPGGRRVVVDMGVIASDLADRSRTARFRLTRHRVGSLPSFPLNRSQSSLQPAAWSINPGPESDRGFRATGVGETLLDVALDVLEADQRFLVHSRDLLEAGLRRAVGIAQCP